MEFLVLGPIEARSGRASLPLGGPRQRAVLADLLLHAGSVVSMDTLIDDLWGEEPAATADAVVQNAVSRLRRVLGKDLIETRAPGYRLRVDPGAIDARRFERLVRDARPLPPAERSAALGDALALWRGPAFADLSFESFLQGEIARLDELRLGTLEDRIEAQIDLRRHDEAIPDIARLAAQHPDRERLCRLLMVALQRAGRQQEALDAYEATRRALDELWGLEPSEETRALHHMILTQNPAIADEEAVAVVVGRVRRPVSLLLVEPILDDELELEAAGAVLEDVRRTVGEVAGRHGGTLSPDSAMELVAAFGVDGAHEDDVVRAARAAVELREILSSRDVETRQAVGTGRLLVEGLRPVLVGAVVGRTRRALRDADVNEIQLTAIAARLGGDAFELDADGRLLGVRPGRPRPTGEPAPLVGRTEELAGLGAAFDRTVETGRPVHAVVVGDAGIGKTRFVAAFVETVSAVVLEAACTPYGEGITFLPLRELAVRAASQDEDAPSLGDLESADAALAAVRTLLEHFTASGPLVVVLDDLHWAVPTFLDLVEYVVRAVDGALLVISVARPELLERRASWGEGATVLEPLGAEDARRLVDALPERDALDDELAATVLETAEGVPLFLEQLVAHVAGSDLAVVPGTLDALLASRIDALEPGERTVLARAAVVGRAFSRESLGALTPESEARRLPGRLDSLERRRLVRPRGPEHEFVHPLVRGAAYDAIARPERAAMHEAFARWLDDRGESDELVGTHLERAALDSKAPALAREAALRLSRAGAAADARLDDWAALSLFERAAALLAPEDPDRLEIECMLGKSLKDLSELPRAVALLEDVADRSRVANNRRIELRAEVELVWPRLLDGSLSDGVAKDLLDEGVAFFDELNDHFGVARAEFAHVLRLGDFGHRADRASEHLVRAETAYRRAGVEGSTIAAQVWLALHGTTPVDRAIALAREHLIRYPDHLRAVASLRLSLATLAALADDLVSARSSLDRARKELFELGMEVELQVIAADVAGSIAAHSHEWEAAETSFDGGLAYTRHRGWTFYRAWGAYFLARLAETALNRDDADRARALAEEAMSSLTVDDRLTRIASRRVLGRAFAAIGHTRKAVNAAREAAELAKGGDDLVERGEAALDLADVLRHVGRRDEAREAASEGLRLLESKGAVLLVKNGRRRFSELVGADGGARSSSGPAAERINS